MQYLGKLELGKQMIGDNSELHLWKWKRNEESTAELQMYSSVFQLTGYV